MTFTYTRLERIITVYLGWFQIRFADLSELMWTLVVRRSDYEPELVLLTTIPITDAAQAQLVYEQWRLRPAIEHTYRFDQEQRLDVEDMRCLFVLVLLTALFVAHLAATLSFAFAHPFPFFSLTYGYSPETVNLKSLHFM